MKKKKFTTSFDDLIKNHYGGSDPNDARVAVRVEELFTNYYGKSAVRGDSNTPPSVVLTLSCDDGETLAQQPKEKRFEGYVAQHSIADSEFEEYVVEGGALSRQSSIEAKAENLPAEEVSAFQEYQVDVLQPLKEAIVPGSSTTMDASPSEAAFPPGRWDGSQRQSVAAQLSPSNQETSRAEATDNEFFADMKAILSGQKVYDPVIGKTTEKDKLGRSQSISSQNGGNDLPAPESKNSQAIFDRIAQSMQFANAYDLGTVELEKRFSDFDKIIEIQQKAEAEKKSKNRQTPVVDSSPGATVDSADFIQDLEAIQKQRSAMGAPLEIPAMSSSTAVGDQGKEYSRPFYDTGEHVLTGGDLYKDRLRVGKAPGVLFSYGQIIAMADLYESVDQMMGDEVSKLTRLKELIGRSTLYYMTGETLRFWLDTLYVSKFLDVSNEKWDDETHGRYLKLAEKNFEHFSPNFLFKGTVLGNVAYKYGNNKTEWERHHRWAIRAARDMFFAHPNVSLLLDWPLIINAFGDHFLTDAFAAGHMINKEMMIELFKKNFYNGKSLKPEATAFLKKLADKAFTGKVKEEFSKLETADFKWKFIFPVGHPDIYKADRFYEVLKGIAEQEPERIGNLVVKALHDWLNKHGIQVFNNAGDKPWKLYGDQYLNTENLDIIRKAVQQSVDNINDPSIFLDKTNYPILGDYFNYEEYFSKVWKHVPQLTESSQKTLERLMEEYTSPNSDPLVDAVAEIITEQLDLLVKKLIDAKALRPA